MTADSAPTTLRCTCYTCGNSDLIPVLTSQVNAWLNGTLIQNAFPELPAEQREYIKSGICPSCWDAMFSLEDEPDDEDWELQVDRTEKVLTAFLVFVFIWISTILIVWSANGWEAMP